MRGGAGPQVRCAIYTRKSSEEGLEQSFNSLDAQREACSAHILSQASEGWNELSDRYDDGGISGGTLERPGLQRLLADVAAGRVDIIALPAENVGGYPGRTREPARSPLRFVAKTGRNCGLCGAVSARSAI